MKTKELMFDIEIFLRHISRLGPQMMQQQGPMIRESATVLAERLEQEQDEMEKKHDSFDHS